MNIWMRLGGMLLIVPCIATAANRQTYTLELLIESAMSTHPQVLSQISARQAAEDSVSSAKWGYWPTVTGNSDTYEGRQIGSVSVIQPLWTGGAISSALDIAEYQKQGAESSYKKSRDDIAEQVISSYGNWLAATETLKVINNTATELKNFKAQILRRVSSGVSSRVDIELVNSRIAQAQSDLDMAKSQQQVAVSQLEQLSGLRLSDRKLAVMKDRDIVLSFSHLLSSARERSPALEQAKANSQAAKAQIEQKKSVYWPRLSLVAQHSYGSYEVEDYPTDNRLMLRVEMSPGAGLSSMSEVSAAESRYNGSIAEIEAVNRQLTQLMTSLFSQYRSLKQSRNSSLATLQAAKNVLESYKRLYIVGKRQWLDLMNSVREVDQTARALASLDANIFVVQKRLELYAYGAGAGEK